jgi:sec-independent protein translocase protein TatA
MQQRGMRVIFQSIGATELLIILGIVVLLFGAGKLSGVGGALGKSIREFREERDSTPKKLPKEESEDKKVLKSGEVEPSEKAEK